jgi:hypothetical protein
VVVSAALVGLGVAALLVTIQAGTRASQAGREITQATYLAQEIREWMLKLPFRDPQNPTNPAGPDPSDPTGFVDDVDDLMNATYSPPVNANGGTISGLVGWSQHITLEWKDPNALSGGSVPAGSSDVIRALVTVAHNGRTVLTAGWLVNRRTTE